MIPSSLLAQDQQAVAPGDRIRVTAPAISADRLVGTLTGMRDDTYSMVVEGRDGSLAVPIASLTRLEVSRGRKSLVTWGAVVGVLVGGTLSFALINSSEASDARITSAVLFAGLGGLAGALGGSYIRYDDWETVPLGQLRVGLTPEAGDGIALSISIRL
jgi:hypothetical protein